MAEKKNAFSRSNVIKDLPFIAFVRTKTAKGRYSYDFPFPQDWEKVECPATDKLSADSSGCPDIVAQADKDGLARAISLSEENMSVCQESFGIVSADGKRRWLSGASVPKKKKNGDVVWKGFWADVSGEKLQDSFNALFLESVQEGGVVFDRQGNILSVSPFLSALLECSREEIGSKTIFSLLPVDVADTLQQYMLLSALKEKISVNVSLQQKNGRQVYLEIDMMQKDSLFICLFRDITAHHEKEEELRYLAYHDVNTGVENYAYLQTAFEKAVAQAKVEQTQIAVLSVTPDSMGQLNAISVQEANSKIVAGMADRIRSCLSENDFLAQTGAHHFSILLTNLEYMMEIEKKVNAILHSFDQPIYVNDLEFDLSVSIGVCSYPQDGERLPDLISRADLALGQMTAGEKSTLHIYNNDLSVKAAIGLNMRHNLKKAIANHEIGAFFQPQVDIKTGQIVGLEALARWHTGCGDLIPPSEFIPEAEECGMIDALTETILEQACQWNQKWYSMGLCRVPVSVNISGRQFHNEAQLLGMVDKALNDTGLLPYLLELELTESSAMYDPENAQRIIQTLLDNDIRCALDDFGTGYSSLSVLRSFPLKKLKIDRSFVLELNEKKNLEIVRATIAMAHALNLSVLAEGVENRQHFEILRDLDCDIIQGYLFSRPLSPEQMELMLMRWDAGVAVDGHGF